MKKSIIYLSLFVCFGLSACHESIEDRAEREAKEYTEKNCPTPERDNSILDSITFDRSTHTMNHYYTLTGAADDTAHFVGSHPEMHEALADAIKNQTSNKMYKDAGFNFAYEYRSLRNKHLVLFLDTVKPKDYK
ncbi:MAG: hypothetical protein IKX22_07695 [Prevotella sp.]|nr:hypothetical protein [Prevotella sp.]